MQNPTITTSDLIAQSLPNAMDYDTYRNLVHELTEQGSTTGPEQTEALINYTQLNDRRMKRWDKTLKISEELQEKIGNATKDITLLVLTESWCGDAAPSLPVMDKIASLNPNISLKILLRDEHLALMDRFLTNEARSIPKLVVLDNAKDEVIAEWGPRPSIATKMAADYKAEHGLLSAAFKQDLQQWYNKDKGQNILADIIALLPLK